MVVVKIGFDLLHLETVKSALSQEWIDETRLFFACLYKFMESKSYFNKYWVDMVKNGGSL